MTFLGVFFRDPGGLSWAAHLTRSWLPVHHQYFCVMHGILSGACDGGYKLSIGQVGALLLLLLLLRSPTWLLWGP